MSYKNKGGRNKEKPNSNAEPIFTPEKFEIQELGQKPIELKNLKEND